MAYKPRARRKYSKTGSRSAGGYRRSANTRRSSTRRKSTRATAPQTLRIVIEQNTPAEGHPLANRMTTPRPARF